MERGMTTGWPQWLFPRCLARNCSRGDCLRPKCPPRSPGARSTDHLQGLCLGWQDYFHAYEDLPQPLSPSCQETECSKSWMHLAYGPSVPLHKTMSLRHPQPLYLWLEVAWCDTCQSPLPILPASESFPREQGFIHPRKSEVLSFICIFKQDTGFWKKEQWEEKWGTVTVNTKFKN